MYFTTVFEIPFDLPKILNNLLLLKFLLACIMVNPISLVILLTSLLIIILTPLIQYIANVHNHQSNPRIILPAQTSFGYELVLDQSMPWSVVLLSPLNL